MYDPRFPRRYKKKPVRLTTDQKLEAIALYKLHVPMTLIATRYNVTSVALRYHLSGIDKLTLDEMAVIANEILDTSKTPIAA